MPEFASEIEILRVFRRRYFLAALRRAVPWSVAGGFLTGAVVLWFSGLSFFLWLLIPFLTVAVVFSGVLLFTVWSLRRNEAVAARVDEDFQTRERLAVLVDSSLEESPLHAAARKEALRFFQRSPENFDVSHPRSKASTWVAVSAGMFCLASWGLREVVPEGFPERLALASSVDLQTEPADESPPSPKPGEDGTDPLPQDWEEYAANLSAMDTEKLLALRGEVLAASLEMQGKAGGRELPWQGLKALAAADASGQLLDAWERFDWNAMADQLASLPESDWQSTLEKAMADAANSEAASQLDQMAATGSQSLVEQLRQASAARQDASVLEQILQSLSQTLAGRDPPQPGEGRDAQAKSGASGRETEAPPEGGNTGFSMQASPGLAGASQALGEMPGDLGDASQNDVSPAWERLESLLAQGESLDRMIHYSGDRPAGGGISLREWQAIQSAVEESFATDPVPVERRDLVRRYFDRLRPPAR
jgi:hypothetical protein